MLNFLPQYTAEVTDTTGDDPTPLYTNGVGSVVITGTSDNYLYASLNDGTIPGQIFVVINATTSFNGVYIGGTLVYNTIFVWDGFNSVWRPNS